MFYDVFYILKSLYLLLFVAIVCLMGSHPNPEIAFFRKSKSEIVALDFHVCKNKLSMHELFCHLAKACFGETLRGEATIGEDHDDFLAQKREAYHILIKFVENSNDI